MRVEHDVDGNMTFTLHNTPYLQIQKYWKESNDGDVLELAETEGFKPVYVRLYRSSNGGSNEIVTGELAGQKNVIQVGDDYLIELNYGNKWFAEYAVPRKMAVDSDPSRVRQCTYSIVECFIDSDGTIVECGETPIIQYGSVRKGNSTRVLESGKEYSAKGFRDRTITGKTGHHEAYVQGNNYPEIILTVTNIRGTNVLPKSGGVGDIPFMAAGMLTASAALMGRCIYKKREKNKIQRRGMK